MTSLYVARTQPTSVRRRRHEAIGEGHRLAKSACYLSFGLFFFDYDLDGRLDLLQANGHLEDEINTVQASQHYEQPVQLFWNAGPESRAAFVEVPPEQTGDLGRPLVRPRRSLRGHRRGR